MNENTAGIDGTETPWRVRPLTAGDVITDSLRLMRSDFWRLCSTVAVVVVPANVIIAVVIYLFMRHMGKVPYIEPDAAALGLLYYGALLGGAAALWGLVIPFAQVALVRAITDRYMGRPVRVLRAYRWVVENFWMVTGTIVLVALILFVVIVFVVVPGMGLVIVVAAVVGGPVGMMLLIAGGLAVAVPFVGAMFLMMMAVPSMVTEGQGGGQAIGRSFRLVMSQPGKLMLLVGITWLLSLTVSTLPGLFMPTPDVDLAGPTGIFDYYNATALATALTTALAGLTQSVIRTLRGTVYLLAYFDSRCRTEGFDVEFEARKVGIWQEPVGA